MTQQYTVCMSVGFSISALACANLSIRMQQWDCLINVKLILAAGLALFPGSPPHNDNVK